MNEKKIAQKIIEAELKMSWWTMFLNEFWKEAQQGYKIEVWYGAKGSVSGGPAEPAVGIDKPYIDDVDLDVEIYLDNEYEMKPILKDLYKKLSRRGMPPVEEFLDPKSDTQKTFKAVLRKEFDIPVLLIPAPNKSDFESIESSESDFEGGAEITAKIVGKSVVIDNLRIFPKLEDKIYDFILENETEAMENFRR